MRTEEDPECNRLLLHIYNNELDELPGATRASIESLLLTQPDSSSNSNDIIAISNKNVLAGGSSISSNRSKSKSKTNLHHANNLRGDLARVIIITASGAEGISLKNVRQVHMLESFWNHNRLDQVIGRAVRAKSHADLPRDERRVEVFLYLSTFKDAQREQRDIMRQDKGLTSDQYLHSIAQKKKNLTDQVLALMTTASVDCRLHSSSSSYNKKNKMKKVRDLVNKEKEGQQKEEDEEEFEEDEKCFELPKNLQDDRPYRSLFFADEQDDARYARRVSKLLAVQVEGVRYYMEELSGKLYDYEKLKNENTLHLVGSI